MANTKIPSELIADSSITAAKLADGTITTADIADSNVTTAKIADQAITRTRILASERWPIGAVMSFAGPDTKVPAGWLMAAGASVSRAEYANLFAVIGTTYGSVSIDTFTLPDLRGAFVCGVNSGEWMLGSKSLGVTGGSDTKTLSIANLPQHQHNVNHSHAPTDAQGSHQHFVEAWTGQNWVQGIFGYQGPAIGGGGYLIQSQSTYSGFAGTHAHNVPAYTGLSGVGGGLSTPLDIRPPFIHLNYIIKT